MSKYYLLTFNEELSDGTPVPALACFNEEHMNVWLNTASGELVDDYHEKIAEWENTKAKRDAVIEQYKEKGLWGKSFLQLTPEDKLWKRANPIPYVWDKPWRVRSEVNCNICCDDDLAPVLCDYHLMAEFVANKVVEVEEVDEAFYHTFNKKRLFRLSLCDVFEKGVGFDPYNKQEKEVRSISEESVDEFVMAQEDEFYGY